MLPPMAGDSADIEASRNAEQDIQQEEAMASTSSEGGSAHVIRTDDAANGAQRLGEKAQVNGTGGGSCSFV